jgi:hypothetical protein
MDDGSLVLGAGEADAWAVEKWGRSLSSRAAKRVKKGVGVGASAWRREKKERGGPA